MQIIIVGCGKVGIALTEQLSREEHNITIIDNNYDTVKVVSGTYDVMGIAGNGASYKTLMDADIEHTDMLIAVTESDELNLLCCVIAKKHPIAIRLRGYGIRFTVRSGNLLSRNWGCL